MLTIFILLEIIWVIWMFINLTKKFHKEYLKDIEKIKLEFGKGFRTTLAVSALANIPEEYIINYIENNKASFKRSPFYADNGRSLYIYGE